MIGNINCQILSINDTQIECNLTENTAGQYQVKVVSDYGYSNNDKTFTYELLVENISNFQG